MLAMSGALEACVPPVVPHAGTDANGLVLPPGFTSRIIAQGGQKIAGTGHDFPVFPDGAATFVDPAVPGGWFYAVNHEIPFGGGGVSSIRFAPDGTIVDAYEICTGTSLNCAGGATPWGTWLSGEEHELGVIWECDPTAPSAAIRRGALGTLYHEAAAVASDGRVYLTEDRPDGCFYRFTPNVPGDLSAGLLEVMAGASYDGPVTWVAVPDPNASNVRCREQVPSALHFDGSEGIATMGDAVWFTTKGDNRVWVHDLAASTIGVRFQGGGSTILEGVDNLWIDRASSTLLVAEDGGDMQVVALRPDDTLVAIAQCTGHVGSEITGPCFSPDGQRLYFSSQRGPTTPVGLIAGISYEVSGPFDDLLGR
jgi:secreted PhoX family phosphatase